MLKALKSFASYMITGIYTIEKDLNMARIVTTDNGATLYADGVEVATYSRARDAKRGAARRGLTLA